jgi:hypothetical protein
MALPARREREQRAYLLGLTSAGAGVATVVLLVLSIAGVVGFGLVLLAAIIAAGAAYGFRKTVG